MRKKKIGLVDDHDLFRATMISLIKSHAGEYEVTTEACDGEDLLEKLKELPPEDLPEIIITDLDMPKMNGYSVAQVTQTIYPAIKIIALSVRSDENILIQLIRFGVNGFLHKGLDPAELPVALKAVENSQFYFPSPRPDNKYADRFDKSVIKLPSKCEFADMLESLTPMEKEAMVLYSSTMRPHEIARSLKLSFLELESLRQHFYKKMQVSDRITLAVLVNNNMQPIHY